MTTWGQYNVDLTINTFISGIYFTWIKFKPARISNQMASKMWDEIEIDFKIIFMISGWDIFQGRHFRQNDVHLYPLCGVFHHISNTNFG